MKGRKAIGAAVAALVAASATFAFASTLGLSSSQLGVASAAMASCDSSFTFVYTTSGGNVTGVTVGDLADPVCEGGSLSLTLVDSTGASIASGGPVTIAADGDTLPGATTVAVTPSPAAESVAGVRLAIVGP